MAENYRVVYSSDLKKLEETHKTISKSCESISKRTDYYKKLGMSEKKSQDMWEKKTLIFTWNNKRQKVKKSWKPAKNEKEKKNENEGKSKQSICALEIGSLLLSDIIYASARASGAELFPGQETNVRSHVSNGENRVNSPPPRSHVEKLSCTIFSPFKFKVV